MRFRGFFGAWSPARRPDTTDDGMRFVQLADTHLDSYISSAMGLTKEKSAALMADVRTAFSRACALAVDRKADCVLIPGDLFDYETVDPNTVAFITSTLAGINPIPVFIAPGNHDSLHAGSPYLGQWPSNVHVFKSPEFEIAITETRKNGSTEDAGQCFAGSSEWSVTGIAHAHRGITDRLLASPIQQPGGSIKILLFHGSRDGYKPSDKETVIPFSDAELLAQGFTYAAIGHYHSFAAISDAQDHIRAAYSGCAQGRGLDEAGEKCALVGEISPDGRVELERVEVAPRRIVRVEVDVTGSRDANEVFARMDATVSAQARQCDVACVSLTGLLTSGIDPDTSLWQSRQPYFATVVNLSGVDPDYNLEAIGRESAASPLRSAFVRKMLERQAQAASEEDRLTVRDAIYYGLYALDGRKLEPRDAD